MKFYIQCRGDMSVGIPGAQCVLDWPELSEDQSDLERKVFIQSVKGILQKAFVDIFDDNTTSVWTEKEYEAYTREEPDQEAFKMAEDMKGSG